MQMKARNNNAGLIAGILGVLGLAGAGAYAYSRRRSS